MSPETNAKKTILVVDDEPNIISYLEALLQDNGFNTLSAINGQEAINLAKSHKPDLVSLDISMPEKSGVRATDFEGVF